MIQDFARHIDILRIEWKLSISAVLLPTEGKWGEELNDGWRCPRWNRFQSHREPHCPISMETSLVQGWSPRDHHWRYFPLKTTTGVLPHKKTTQLSLFPLPFHQDTGNGVTTKWQKWLYPLFEKNEVGEGSKVAMVNGDTMIVRGLGSIQLQMYPLVWWGHAAGV